MEPANDMKAAERTYAGFVSMIKWSVPVLAVSTLIIIVLIS